MTRHAFPMIALHWLTALAVVVAYVSSGDPSKASHALSGQIHVTSGFAVFLLVALRLPLRLLMGVPAAVPGPRWQQRAARAAHGALYALLFAVPLAGWAELADKAHAFSVLGWALPLPDAGALWVRALGAAHTTLGDALVWLAGLHAAAALAHHYVLRDGTLARMLPRRG
ncbi:MAG: cytochrome b/b6 domain-containing protein [Pseudomonadota bacterium]